ncbi:MAG: DUF2786 domain-containing protein [Planctomycetes bacterium]|nr:DUF2786 domain-containing protein [Planctomycetota bacterium]MCB9891925.1 DUF2786 domain-containing protein [Planctomycetota bacterium]
MDKLARSSRERDDEDPLLEVEPIGHLHRVRLPAPYAQRTVERYFGAWSIAIEVILPAPDAPCLGLRDGEWAIACFGNTRTSQRLLRPTRAFQDPDLPGRTWYVFPCHTLLLHPSDVALLRRCLESEKPERVGEDGLPAPWVPLQGERAAIRFFGGNEGDVTVVTGPLPGLEPPPDAQVDVEREAFVREAFSRLCELAGFPNLPLRAWRGRQDKHGFVTGHLTKDGTGVPKRIVVTLCPNADRAEIEATLLHELAHGIAPGTDHSQPFKDALIDLAERAHGAAFFGEARARRGERYAEVDRWVATGVRAALQGADPPRAQAPDDGQTARLVNRIRKLRALAASAPGTSEAVTATGLANDLVTRFELAGYEVMLEAGLDDQLVDRWFPVEKGKVWKRALAHTVAKFSSVFSLDIASKARMHFFGKHRDIESAIYLYRVAERHIEEACERHLRAWKRLPIRPAGSGATRRERTSFCDTAVVAFASKLDGIQEEERKAADCDPKSADAQAFALARRDFERAESFAREEYEKRGDGWTGGSGKLYYHNDEGHAAGLSIEVTRATSRHGGRLLGDRRQLPDS